MKPKRRMSGVDSVEACAQVCQRLSSIKCTMFVVRKRNMRCWFYDDSTTKSLSSDFDEFIRDAGFTIFTMLLDGDEPVRDTTQCIQDDDPLGVKYRGTKSKTLSGIKCQRWSKNSPHRPTYRPSNAGKHKNFCRNPDMDSGGIWCYTTNKKKRWEYCDVPKCSELLPKTTTPRAETESTTTPEPVPKECYICNGYGYVGNLTQTISGKTCQRWDASHPHQHSNHPSQKPGRNLDSNFCRNPDGDTKPWCYTTDPNTRWEHCDLERCTNADGSVLIPLQRITTECIIGAGGNYRGTKQVTRSGKTCAQWTSQSLHKHTKTPDQYPCSGLEENYCRNPSANFDQGPWCYTTDPSTRWETCGIPECGTDGGPPPTTTTTTTTSTAPSTSVPGTCGSPTIESTYYTQGFAIVGGRLVETRRRKRGTEQQERILGGDIAYHGSWPWSASLRYYDGHFCGGTLIQTTWVLTASHCLDDNSPPDHMSVKIGHNRGSEPQMQMRKVLRYILHESYSKSKVKNDIALIQLKVPFQITDYVRTACLPQPDYEVPGESFCVVTGWGNTYDPKYQNDLKQAVLQVHSYEKCMRYMSSFHMKDKTQMCAGTRGAGIDTCRGDSGGPLVCLNSDRWTIQGVTSWGSGCEDKKGSYGSYTRVSKYIGWIKKNMEKYG
uniref:plasminogen-like n=1 Tax=Styela clava TaxID=7725 RepID=UPI001939A659|nr:plasminogen-like [Styela clava]